MNFLKEMTKAIDTEYDIVSEGIKSGDVSGWVDTGSYALNALVSGSIFKGYPGNKSAALAGKQAVGKSFFVLESVKQFLAKHTEGVVFFFETEGALTSQTCKDRGIAVERMIVVPVSTVEEFKFASVKLLEKYKAMPAKERQPIMFVLDSLGMLSTSKEMGDAIAGSEKKDMTRAQLIKGVFRIITLKMSRYGVPLLVTNHTYDEQGAMYPQELMSGGCLTESSRVVMADGTVRSIANIKLGDEVQTMFGPKRVTNTFKYEDKQILRLKLADGYCIECTPEHKFLVKDGDSLVWVKAKDLTESHQLVQD